jgi:putative tryptophan/tyrosine transport system substrate-binding protein
MNRYHTRKWSLRIALPLSWFCLIGSVEAQQAKIPQIGFIGGASASFLADRLDAFRRGLRDLGYEEGKNIVLEYRYGDGKLDRLPELAAELVQRKVDVIVSGGPSATRPAKAATNTIPIVLAFDNDPVGNGFITSLARPGGNITGLSTLAPEISGKQVELLKEILPKLSRVAVFGTSTQLGTGQAHKEMERAAVAIGLKLRYLDVLAPADIETAFRAATKDRADAVLMLSSAVLSSEPGRILPLAAKNRIPAIYPWPEFVEAGGLMTYGVSLKDLFRRAAIYVDKILKGAKPADLPVEQPTKFELSSISKPPSRSD